MLWHSFPIRLFQWKRVERSETLNRNYSFFTIHYSMKNPVTEMKNEK